MGVLVIYRLPDKRLLCKNTDTLFIPPIGHTYVFDASYEVAATVQPLSPRGGFGKILDLLRLEYDDAASATTAIGGMINLDAPKLELAGKVTIATEPDDVLLIRLKKPGSKAASKPPTISLFELDVKSLFDNGAGRLTLDVPPLDVNSLAARAQQGLGNAAGRRRTTGTGGRSRRPKAGQ